MSRANDFVPKWLRLEEMIARYSYFLIQVHEELQRAPRDPLSRMVDQASGFSAAMLRKAQRICRGLKRTKILYAKETGVQMPTEMEDAILALGGTKPGKG